MKITIRNLEHTFATARPPVAALQAVNLTIASGEFVALIGPSGCGKSTLLRILAHLLPPTAGTVELDGLTPATAVAQRHIAWLAQNPALLPWYTTRENVALARRVTQANHHEPEELLQMVGLGDFADAYPFTLSGGMQQRLALARVLAQQAAVWLMDEPFAALDELTRERLTGELLHLWQQQRPTVLWVTHHVYEATRLADRALILSPRPATIRAEVNIPLPRPRDDTSPAFLALVQTMRAALRDG
jgi:NitT/TauT family transport system ATP-binding protein